MLTSKQLLEKMGISRATMNNYIALRLLPKPDVEKPEGAGEGPVGSAIFPTTRSTASPRFCGSSPRV